MLRLLSAALAVLLAVLLALDATTLVAQGTDPAADSTTGRRRILPLPAIGSAPETGLQYGIAVLAVFDPPTMDHARPASMLLSAIRTTKGQLRASFDAERWSRHNDWRFAFNGAWQKFPLPFYGFGDATPEGARELYTPQGVDLATTVQRRLAGPLYAVGSARLINTDIVRTDTIGALRTGAITGSTGGRSVEVTAGVLVDSRDHLFAPTRGSFSQVTIGRAGSGIGSDFAFTRLRADLRQYMSVGVHTFAIHGLLHGVSDGAPFDNLALVGGNDIMRGYTRGRYRDRWTAAAQAEYRSPMRHRLGVVAFAGAGVVDSTLASLSGARVLPTYGAGIRFQLDAQQRTAVRLDHGRGANGATGLYIGFNQAF